MLSMKMTRTERLRNEIKMKQTKENNANINKKLQVSKSSKTKAIRRKTSKTSLTGKMPSKETSKKEKENKGNFFLSQTLDHWNPQRHVLRNL
eukprot:GFUD01131418.1.p1 GENE.GFUD01131418.1~~GFUD01131418.1.p1  ORF type:complete len:106 (-),score=25.89 GFUD01131418.1:41-316(-)